MRTLAVALCASASTQHGDLDARQIHAAVCTTFFRLGPSVIRFNGAGPVQFFVQHLAVALRGASSG